MQNPCMGEAKSCSACCGLFNLKADDQDRRAWVTANTEKFLALDISSAANIVNYRKERESETLPNRVRDDIYVCPFIGFVAGDKTGCLLHPQGSPHSQISLWQHPQNFSFYGEGICLSYDCLAKERQVYRADFFRWAESSTVFDYARLASDHTLHRAPGDFTRHPGKPLPFLHFVIESLWRVRRGDDFIRRHRKGAARNRRRFIPLLGTGVVMRTAKTTSRFGSRPSFAQVNACRQPLTKIWAILKMSRRLLRYRQNQRMAFTRAN
jgi:hypothetical protein